MTFLFLYTNFGSKLWENAYRVQLEKCFLKKRLMIWFIASASCWRFDKKLVCTEKSLMVESSGFRSGGLEDIATIPISCNDFMRW